MSDSLFLGNGSRKYLNPEERRLVLQVARSLGNDVGLFCWILVETGCRISEALALTWRSIDIDNGAIVFSCLKKRRTGVYRSVPVSEALTAGLDRRFRIKDRLRKMPVVDARLWEWCRMTAYRYICDVMRSAGVHGPQASPKGLRHGFGIAAVSNGVPLNLVQRWLGHADLKTTAIYTNACGPEERLLAERMWTMSGVGKPGTDRLRRAAARPREEAGPLPAPPPSPESSSSSKPVIYAPSATASAVNAALDIKALRRLGYCVTRRPRRKGRKGTDNNGGRGGRPDPLGEIWRTDIVPILEGTPDLRPCELLREVARLHPERDFGHARRTLERRVREWRESHV